MNRACLAFALVAAAYPMPATPARQAEKKPPARLDALGDPLPAGAVLRLGTTRLRHGRSVAALALSPDGQALATCCGGSFDRPIRVWDVATEKEIRRIAPLASTYHFTALAFSPDGRTLASGEQGMDESGVWLWDVATGKQIRRVGSHRREVARVVFSPDDKTIASCGRDKVACLWEVATSREVHRWKDHMAEVFGLAFSPDGKTLATGGRDKKVRLWNVETGVARRVIEGYPECVSYLAFSPDGTVIATASFSHPLVRLTDAASGKALKEAAGHRHGVGGLAYAPDGKTLLWADRDGTVRVWDVAAGKELRRLRVNCHDDLHNMALSRDGRTVAAGDDGQTIASGATDGTVRLWDARTGKSRKLSDTNAWVQCVEFSPDGKTLAAADDAGKGFTLRDVATAKVLRRFDGHGTAAMAFSPDGKTVASGGILWLLSLWDVSTGKELRPLPRVQGATAHIAFSPDGRRIATQSENGEMTLWDSATRRAIHTIENARGAPTFSPDGRLLMAGGERFTLLLLDAATGRLSRELKLAKREDDVAGVGLLGKAVFSPDGKYAALSRQRHLLVIELSTGQEVRSFTGTRAGAYVLAYAPDGRTVASSDWACVLTWDITGRAPDGRLREERLGPKGLESCWDDLSSDDAPCAHRAVWSLVAGAKQALPFLRERLLTRPAVEDKQVRRWVADLDSETFAVRQKATDELTRIGRLAEPALREALKASSRLEQRRRIEQLLGLLAAPSLQRRAGRVTGVLEQIGTPEARKVLEALAKEVGVLGREAKASLGRIDKSKE